jgi:hypothetical protein
LLGDIAHALRIGELALGADADEAIVRVGMFAFDVVNVVGGDEF